MSEAKPVNFSDAFRGEIPENATIVNGGKTLGDPAVALTPEQVIELTTMVD